MEFQTLGIEQFRNLNQVELELSSGLNVFTGANGAGKTSVLEACYYLSHGRSFRNGSSHSLIERGQDQFRIVGHFLESKNQEHTIGIEKTARSVRTRLDGCDVSSQVECTRLLPILAVHPGTFSLITGDPAARRAFLDWGAFYQNSAFEHHWRAYQRALKQRNAALRQGANMSMVRLWDHPLLQAAVEITKAREKCIDGLKAKIPLVLDALEIEMGVEMVFRQGWPLDKTLSDVLQEGIDRDRRLGYTYNGPHRADLVSLMDRMEASKYASRGQTKIVTIVLVVAQALLFGESISKGFVLLLDDLSAELDQENFLRVMEVVRTLEVQALITGLSPGIHSQADKLFHVKHGGVAEML